jgi:two-component system, OmpR family, response regulator
MLSLVYMTNTTVLIVEDDENIRELYKAAFTEAGIHVLLAQSGEEAIQMALEYHPNAILMDIMLPGMRGHEAVGKIRLDAWGKHAKVIYLTNMSDAENVFLAVQQGTEEYITKANTPVKEVVNQVRMAMRA